MNESLLNKISESTPDSLNLSSAKPINKLQKLVAIEREEKLRTFLSIMKAEGRKFRTFNGKLSFGTISKDSGIPTSTLRYGIYRALIIDASLDLGLDLSQQQKTPKGEAGEADSKKLETYLISLKVRGKRLPSTIMGRIATSMIAVESGVPITSLYIYPKMKELLKKAVKEMGLESDGRDVALIHDGFVRSEGIVHTQTNEYMVLTSEYSGNSLFFNKSPNEFMVPPTWSKLKLQAFLDLPEGLSAVWDRHNLKISPYPRKAKWLVPEFSKRLRGVETIDAFCKEIDSLVEIYLNPSSILPESPNQWLAALKTVSLDIVFSLYAWDLLTFPLDSKDYQPVISLLNLHSTPSGKTLNQFLEKSGNGNIKTRLTPVIRYFMTISGIQGATDLTPTTLLEIYTSVEGRSTTSTPWISVTKTLVEMVSEVNPNLRLIYPLNSETAVGPFKTARRDYETDPELKKWTDIGKAFLQAHGGVATKNLLVGLHCFLKYLQDHPGIPREPLAYFDKLNPPSPLVDPSCYHSTTYNRLVKFVNWAFKQVCFEEDDLGNIINRNPKRYANPLDKVRDSGRNNGQTHREPMPAHLLNVAKQIILENDFEWPKTIDGDYFMRGSERVWCPVRAIAMLTKLCLPARNMQVRLVGSGEGDTYKYQGDGSWVINEGRHATIPRSEIIEDGVFRRYKKNDGAYGSVFYFNTNKTADINKEPKNCGYVMPWPNEEVLGYLTFLRDWQEKFNPVGGPLAWNLITELKQDKSKNSIRNRSDFFLFRDPCNSLKAHCDEPITKGRFSKMWPLLILELERRMNLADGTSENPHPYSFIQTWDPGRTLSPRSCIWDLHTLRVTVISWLYEGGVDPEIIRRIAGHSSLVMTYHYVVIDPDKIAEKIEVAYSNWLGQSPEQFMAFLKKGSRHKFEKLLAYRDKAAIEALFSSSSASLVCMDHGFCPVAQGRCHEGLVVVKDPESGAIGYEQVPGGKHNCVRCRFFMTGIPWLPGLIAHLNQLLYKNSKESRIFQKHEEAFKKVRDEYTSAVIQGRPFSLQREYERLMTAFESAASSSDAIGYSLINTLMLIETCKEIMKRGEGSGEGLALVSMGGPHHLEVNLQEGHHSDLLAAVIREGSIYPAVSDPGEANRDLVQMLDRMLFNNGIPGILVTLSEEEQTVISLQVHSWLKTRLRTSTAFNDVLDCKETLRALGFSMEFEDELKKIEPFKPFIQQNQRQVITEPDLHLANQVIGISTRPTLSHKEER